MTNILLYIVLLSVFIIIYTYIIYLQVFNSIILDRRFHRRQRRRGWVKGQGSRTGRRWARGIGRGGYRC